MARSRELALLMAMVFLAPMLAGCTDFLGSNNPPTATMSTDPSGTIRQASQSLSAQRALPIPTVTR